MDILITICGRAGSKGVKGKNTKSFLGIPLISYTFAAAQLFKIKNLDKYNVDLAVNSDSEDLLNLMGNSTNYYKIKRPLELAQDTSSKVHVIKYSLDYMEKCTNKKYDYIIDLDITSPLRTVNDIEMALQNSIDNIKYDVVFSVVESRRNPYFNMVENENCNIKLIKESNFLTRQQAPKVYDMNASIYVYKRESLLNRLKNSPLDGTSGIYIMKDTAVLDIDSEEDFIMMEILAKYFFEKFNEFAQIFTKAKQLTSSINK